MSSFLAAEADRERFSQELTSSTTYDEFCKAFHVNMRDNRGISVQVEAFCVRFNGSDDKESYLLGFREFADTTSPRRAQQASPGWPSAALTTDIQSRLQSHDDEDTELSNSEGESAQMSAVPELAVWFDALSQGFTMLRCTNAFEMLAGSSWTQICNVEQSLLRCTQPELREDFEYWIRLCIDQFDSGVSEEGAAPLSVNTVRFRFSEHHHRFRLTIENKLTLVLTPADDDEWPVGLGQTSRVVKLVFERPKWIQGGHWTTPVDTSLPNDISAPRPPAERTAGSPAPLGLPDSPSGRNARSGPSGRSTRSRRSGDSGAQCLGLGDHGTIGRGSRGRSSDDFAGRCHGGHTGTRNILAL
jgi:hypothetical protein